MTSILPALATAGPPVPGTPLPPEVIVIERGPVGRFAEAVSSDQRTGQLQSGGSLAANDHASAPPTFLFSAAHWGLFPELQPTPPPGARSLVDLVTAMRADGGMVLHGEQEFVYAAPVRVGDVLAASGEVESVIHKPGKDGRVGMTVMTIRTEYRGQDGLLKVTARATFVHRPPAARLNEPVRSA
jgi:hypothetical protein